MLHSLSCLCRKLPTRGFATRRCILGRIIRDGKESVSYPASLQGAYPRRPSGGRPILALSHTSFELSGGRGQRGCNPLRWGLGIPPRPPCMDRTHGGRVFGDMVDTFEYVRHRA